MCFRVLVERRRADGVELATRQHRLEHVRGVERAFGRARPDDRVQLVDEEDEPALGVHDFLEHGLEALLELAAVLGAGNQCAHVERHDLLVLQAFGDIAPDDALGQPFDDGGLADPGFADEHRIVLGPAGEHLDHAPHFLVAPNHRIELALARELSEVAAVFLEGLVFVLRVRIRHALAATHAGERLEDALARDAALLEGLGRRGTPALGRQPEQQVLGADVVVLHLLGVGGRGVDDDAEAGRQVRLGAAT